MSTKSVSPVAKQLYRPDTGYGTMWAVGSAKFHKDEDALIKATMVALEIPVTGPDSKSYKRQGYNFAVLKSPGHPSNHDRSRLETNAQGHIKLVAIHPENVAKPLPITKNTKKTVVTKKAVTPAATAPASAPAPVPGECSTAQVDVLATPAETPVASN